MKSKLIVVAIFITIFAVIFYLIDETRTDDIEIINKNPKITKGIVVEKSVYKGRSIDVKYYVGGKEYIQGDGILEENKVEVGDTVLVRYSVENPELMITQFNNKF